MILYLDASALVKLYVEEPGSEERPLVDAVVLVLADLLPDVRSGGPLLHRDQVGHALDAGEVVDRVGAVIIAHEADIV